MRKRNWLPFIELNPDAEMTIIAQQKPSLFFTSRIFQFLTMRFLPFAPNYVNL